MRKVCPPTLGSAKCKIKRKQGDIMTTQVKFGLIVGVIGLVVNICVSTLLGICGPVIALLGGGIAGFLTAQAEQAATRSDGARLGAIAGGIAGGLVFIGQLIGGLGALTLIQATGMQPFFGELPSASDPAGQLGYWLGGLGVGMCFGVFGLFLSALTGAGAGYLGTPEQTKFDISS